MSILQELFKTHYEEMIYLLRPRHTIIENVNKMIHCGDPMFGGAKYLCPTCDEQKFTPFRCRSRFCPTCGNMYSIERTTSMSFKLLGVKHRHCVFTIAEDLRLFFLKDRTLLNCLFSATRSVILRMFHQINKSEQFTPGFICVLHTFGRDLKWNPHIHCLISEGGVGNNLFWRKVTHFNYSLLRKSFQTALLNEMHSLLGDSFKVIKSKVYANTKNGFYIYAKPNKCEPKQVLKYVGRYLGRPVIATSRIDNYDGENVTFHYTRHEDNQLVHETLPALTFIEKLIQHIPEKHFKMIRYYGIYGRNRKSDNYLKRAISKEKHKIFRSFNRWRDCILLSFGYDPLTCIKCGFTMQFHELIHNKQSISLSEMYKRVMSKHRGCRSPSKSPFTLIPPSVVKST